MWNACICGYSVISLYLSKILSALTLVLQTPKCILKSTGPLSGMACCHNSVVVPFPGMLSALFLLFSYYPGCMGVSVPAFLGPLWHHALSTQHIPCQVCGVLSLHCSACTSRQPRSTQNTKMCDNTVSFW